MELQFVNLQKSVTKMKKAIKSQSKSKIKDALLFIKDATDNINHFYMPDKIHLGYLSDNLQEEFKKGKNLNKEFKKYKKYVKGFIEGATYELKGFAYQSKIEAIEDFGKIIALTGEAPRQFKKDAKELMSNFVDEVTVFNNNLVNSGIEKEDIDGQAVADNFIDDLKDMKSTIKRSLARSKNAPKFHQRLRQRLLKMENVARITFTYINPTTKKLYNKSNKKEQSILINLLSIKKIISKITHSKKYMRYEAYNLNHIMDNKEKKCTFKKFRKATKPYLDNSINKLVKFYNGLDKKSQSKTKKLLKQAKNAKAATLRKCYRKDIPALFFAGMNEDYLFNIENCMRGIFTYAHGSQMYSLVNKKVWQRKKKQERFNNYRNKCDKLSEKYLDLENKFEGIPDSEQKNPKVVKKAMKKVLELNKSPFFGETAKMPLKVQKVAAIYSPKKVLNIGFNIHKITDDRCLKVSTINQFRLKEYQFHEFHYFIYNKKMKYVHLVNMKDLIRFVTIMKEDLIDAHNSFAGYF